MTQDNPESPERPDWQEIVTEIREDPNLAQDFSREEKQRTWRPKEMSLGVSPWVVRGVIGFLTLALIFEILVLLPTATHLPGLSSQPAVGTPGGGVSAEEVFRDRPPTPTIAPAPPTATNLPPEPTGEPIEIDKSF